jgi:PPIC-type PPIASE domain
MSKSWLMCVLLGTLAWGQAQPGTPAPSSGAAPAASAGGQAQTPAPAAQPPQAPTAGNAAPAPAAAPAPEVAPTARVLTIKGVCPATAPKARTAAPGTKSPAAAKDPAKSSANCETVITRAEFEKMASGIAPNMTPQLKRQLASVYPRLLVMSQEAEKHGLQNSPQYKETMKFARMQILTNELQRSIQEEADKVPQQDITDYYKKNPEAYEQYSLERLYVPRMKQAAEEAEASEKKDSEKEPEKETAEQEKAKQEQEKVKQEQGEQEMSKLAESLRARAAGGEDFTKLQKEAFAAAGMKVESPTVSMPKVRRTGLPPAHAAVFDLKPGEVSAVLSDSGGHYVYKVVSKEQLPLDQVKEEIRGALRTQRVRDAMDKVQNSFKTETNEAYFGPAGPGGMRQPPPRIPHPTAPGAQGQPPAQQPPSAQPPASKPD